MSACLSRPSLDRPVAITERERERRGGERESSRESYERERERERPLSRPRDWLRPRTVSIIFFAAMAAVPPARRSRALERERERLPLSGLIRRPSGPRERDRGPWTSLSVAIPATAAPIVSRNLCFSGSLSRLMKPSTPPAVRAAVRTRLPFSPFQPPSSCLARKAAPAPARTAAFKACWSCSFLCSEPDLSRPLLLLARPSRSRELDRDLLLPVSLATRPPRPSAARASSGMDFLRSRFGARLLLRLREESSE